MAENFIQSFDTGFDYGTLITLEIQGGNVALFKSRVIDIFKNKIPLDWIGCR
jgi:hypothetical protein